MIISQFLLTLFLVYWVYTQYTTQKQLLNKELERGFQIAEQQVIDSILSTQLINPLLNDTSKYFVFLFDSTTKHPENLPNNYKINNDSSQKRIIHISGDSLDLLSPPAHSKQLKEIGISIVQAVHAPGNSQLTVHTEQDTNNDFLLQSVKLLIKSVEQGGPNQTGISSYISANADTTLLKELMDDFIASNYWGITTSWDSVTDPNEGNSATSGILIKCNLCSSYNLIVDHYQLYLYKAISPQIIFAILLLIITAIAFRMAYTNLKEQRKLIVIKNDFISNITHELKTPVSTVKVALEALLDFDKQKDPERTKEYLEMAHSEMNRLDLLVNQVLNNSAFEEGNTFIQPENIDLNTLINDVIQSMQPRIARQKAEINFESEINPTIVFADGLHLHGIILNLIDNSLKYSVDKAEISVKLTQNENETILTIEDNGIGIPIEYIDKVFEKFFRVPNKDKHNVKGYGLGLNYAALVMQQHKGAISVTNLEKGGCSFTLAFPRK